jgi:hypothetical protein
MSETDHDQAPTIEPATPAKKTRKPTPLPVKIIACVLSIGLGVFAFINGRILLTEFLALQRDQARAQDSNFVGYTGITHATSFAAKPSPWFRKDAKSLQLWSRWHEGKHEWFNLGPNDIVVENLIGIEGRDVARAIDFPVIEFTGGPRWVRVPDDATIVGFEHNGVHSAYPQLVMERVRVVNDEFDGKPVIVSLRPYAAIMEATRAYESTLNGKRITMGSSGYFLKEKDSAKNVLYDRGTLSLWIDTPEALEAVSGPLKGSKLNRISTLKASTWSDWRSSHPKTRLVVGGDRTKGMPEM